MPMTTRGTDVAMKRNARTGRWDISRGDDGNPKRTDSQMHRVLSLLIERRPSPGNPGWILDETGTRGSLLYTRGTDVRATPTNVQADCYQALQTAVDGNFIVGPEDPDATRRLVVTVSRAGRGRIDVAIDYSTPAGLRERVAFDLRP